MNFGKLFDAIEGPLLTVASAFIPGGPVILGAVNALLPDNKKLPITATGQDIRSAVASLPPEQRISLMEKELDVEIAEINSWEGIQASLAVADGVGSSTRPYIAKIMAWNITVVVNIFIVVWAVAIFNKDVETLKVLANSWVTIVAVIGTPTALLRAYFGMRTTEKKARYSMASGQPASSGLVGLINAFRSK